MRGADEFARAMVRFVADTRDVVRASKEMQGAALNTAREIDRAHRRSAKEVRAAWKNAIAEKKKAFRDWFQRAQQSVANFARNFIQQYRSIQQSLTRFGRHFRQIMGRNIPRLIRDVIKDLGRLAVSFVQVFSSARKMYQGLSRYLEELTKKIVFLQLDLRYIITQIRNMTIGLIASLAGGVKALMDFEEAFVRVRRVVDMTDRQLDNLAIRLREMSRSMITGAEGLAEIAAMAGRLGIEGIDNIEIFTETVGMLAEVTDIVGETGAQQIARFMVVLDESIDRVDNLASSIVHLGNTFAATEDELLTMSFRLVGGAEAIGLTADETMALSTALTATGVRAERGGTAMTRLMIEMSQAVETQTRALSTFADTAEMSIREFTQTFRHEPIKAMEGFIKGLGRMQDQGENVFETFEDLEIGQIRTIDALLRLASAGDLLTDTLRESEKAFRDGTYHAQEYETRMDTVRAQVGTLWNSIKDLAIMFGEVYRDSIMDAVETTRDLVRAFLALDSEGVEAFARFVNVVLAVAGAMFLYLISARAILVFLTSLTLLLRMLTSLGPWAFAISVINEQVDDFGAVLENVARFADNAAAGLRNFWNAFREGPFVEDLSNVWEGFSTELDELMEVEDPGSEWIVDFISAFVGLIADTLEAVNDAIERYLESEDWEGIDEGIQESMKTLAERMYKVFAEIARMVFVNLPSAMTDVIGDLLEDVDVSGLVDLITEMGSQIYEQLAQAWDEAETSGEFAREAAESMLGMWAVGAMLGGFGIGGIGKALKVPLEIAITVAAGLAKGVALGAGISVWKLLGVIVKGVLGKALAASIVVLLTLDWVVDDDLWDPDMPWESDYWLDAWKDLKEFWDWLTDTLLKPSNWEIDIPEVWTADYWLNILDAFEEIYKSLMKIVDFFELDIDWGWFDADEAGKELTPEEVREMYAPDAKEWSWLLGLFGLSDGAILPGFGGGDRIPALLEAGEAVVPAAVVHGGMDDIIDWFRSMGVPALSSGAVIGTGGHGGGDSAPGTSVLDAFQEQAERHLEELGNTADSAADYILEMSQAAQAGEWDDFAQMAVDALNVVTDTIAKNALRVIDLIESALLAAIPEDLIDHGVITGIFETLRAGLAALITDEDEPGEPPALRMAEQAQLDPGTPPEMLPMPDEQIEEFLEDLGENSEWLADIFEGLIDRLYDFDDSYEDIVRAHDEVLPALEGLAYSALLAGDRLAEEFAVGEEFGDTIGALTGDFSGLAEAVLAAQGPIDGIVAFLLEILQHTEAFDQFMASVQMLFDAFVSIFDPIFRFILAALAPVITMLASLFETVGGLIESVLFPIFKALYPIFEALATILMPIIAGLEFFATLIDIVSPILTILADALEVTLKPVTAVADALTWLQIGIMKVMRGILKGLSRIPFLDFSDQIESLNESIDKAESDQEKLNDMTAEGAWNMEDFGDETADATESMTNVPDVFRVNLRAAESAQAEQEETTDSILDWIKSIFGMDIEGSSSDIIEAGLGVPAAAGAITDGFAPDADLDVIDPKREETHVHFQGDVYGERDFEDKVVRTVDGAKKRGAKRKTGVAAGAGRF